MSTQTETIAVDPRDAEIERLRGDVALFETKASRLLHALKNTGGDENCWCTEWWRQHSDGRHSHKCGDIKDLISSTEALLLAAPPTPAQAPAPQPETPEVKDGSYTADIIALANGVITEREFYERRGRRAL
jgi:hypothetical protein